MNIELEKGEYIILSVRKHWVVFILESLLIAVLALVPFILVELYALMQLDFLSNFSTEQLAALTTFFLSAWELLVFFIFCVALTNYYLDILIVTNKRLVDIEQLGLFSRNISTAPVEKIQDITTEVKGILPVMFRFGNITIQTAGEQKEIIMKGIKNPHNAKEIILKTYNNISTKERG